MSKQEFQATAKQSSVYVAALLANMAHVPMAQVQLWIRTI